MTAKPLQENKKTLNLNIQKSVNKDVKKPGVTPASTTRTNNSLALNFAHIPSGKIKTSHDLRYFSSTIARTY